MFSIREDFVIVPVYKAANDVTFICKYFFALSSFWRELNFDCHSSYQADNSCKYINDKTKEQIIQEYK